jgi:hypothetical protein
MALHLNLQKRVYRRFLPTLSGHEWKLEESLSVQGNKAKRCVEKPIAGCSTGYIADRLKRIQLSSVQCKVSSVTPTPVACWVSNLLEELEPNQSQMVMQVQR